MCVRFHSTKLLGSSQLNFAATEPCASRGCYLEIYLNSMFYLWLNDFILGLMSLGWVKHYMFTCISTQLPYVFHTPWPGRHEGNRVTLTTSYHPMQAASISLEKKQLCNCINNMAPSCWCVYENGKSREVVYGVLSSWAQNCMGTKDCTSTGVWGDSGIKHCCVTKPSYLCKT